MALFDALIKSCHLHLPLFGKSVVIACKTLLTTRPQCSGNAVTTFKNYLQVQDDMTQLDWEFFVQHFTKMIAPSSSEELRQWGLTGLAAFVQATENFDAFVTRFVATAVDAPEETAHNCLWSVLNSSNEPSEGVKSVLTALGTRVNGVTLRQCLDIMCKYYAKKNELVARSEIFALVAKSHMRELLIFLAEVAGSFPGAGVLGLLNVFAGARRNAGPVLDAVASLLSISESGECIEALLQQSEQAEKMEVVAMVLKHGGDAMVALGRRVASSLGPNTVFSSSLVIEVVDRALKVKGEDAAELVRAVAAALKSQGDRESILSRLARAGEAGKEDDDKTDSHIVLLFPEDAAPEGSKAERVTLEVLEKAFADEQQHRDATVKKRGDLPAFSERFEDLSGRLEKERREREDAESHAIKQFV